MGLEPTILPLYESGGIAAIQLKRISSRRDSNSRCGMPSYKDGAVAAGPQEHLKMDSVGIEPLDFRAKEGCTHYISPPLKSCTAIRKHLSGTFMVAEL